MRLIYLHGIAGAPGLSPALDALRAAGHDVVAPALPGFDGRAGFQAPADHLEWLTRVWDTVDGTGALPCPVVGASIGAMFAAELAIFRPEAVTALMLMAPVGICDESDPGIDLYALSGARRLAALFSRGVPAAFDSLFAELGDEQGVARYLAQVAGASLVWPLPDRGLASRIHRIAAPTVVLWGADDRVAPVALARRWSAAPTIIENAGHLLEWDAPDQVADNLRSFLARTSGR